MFCIIKIDDRLKPHPPSHPTHPAPPPCFATFFFGAEDEVDEETPKRGVPRKSIEAPLLDVSSAIVVDSVAVHLR